MFFYIKKPNYLDFRKEEYTNEQIKRFTVANRNNKTNTKIIIYEDGSMYLKNGSEYFKLVGNEIVKPTYACKTTEDGFKVLEKIDKKIFLHKK